MSNRAKIVAIPKTTTTTTTFLPTSIAGCQLWLDGADQTTITGTTTMTSWRDKSTNAYTANSFVNSVAYPSWVSNLQNGNGAVQYTAGNGTSIANFVLAQTMSIFMVYYLINTTNGLFIEHGPDENVTSGFYFYPPGGNNFAINSGTGQVGVNFGNVAIANTWQMIQGINPDPSNSNTMAFYFNGTVKASGSIQSGTTTVTKTLYINGRAGGNSVSFNSYLGELIIFNTALSATNRQTIESYLAQKWGITSSLPVGHPGLTTSVYIQTVALAAARQKIRTIPRAAVFTNFVPTSIAGCVMWLDAADLTSMTLSGANVSQWTDKSGSGNSVTQASSGSQPTTGGTLNGLNTLYFTGKTMTYTGISVSAQTVFCIYLNNTFTPYGEPVAVGPFAFFYAAPSNNVGIGRTGVTDEVLANWSTNSLTTSKYTIYGGTVSVSGSTTSVLYFNGTQVASATVSSSGGSVRYNIGHYASGTTGYLAEVLIYNSVLNQTNRQTVESYLAQKWGLTSNLPVAHPGLTTTVYGTVAAAPTVRQKIRILPPPAPLVSYTQAFAYTGANQTFSVPATTTSITVYMWGAGGAGGYSGVGGAGAYLQGVLSVTPSSSLTVIVGQGGTVNGTSAFGGGGVGSVGGWTGGGGGGGYSGIFNSSTPLAIVGAGGGAAFYSAVGGCGDSVTGTGIRGTTNGSVQSGYGGTQSAGGAGGTGGLANGSAGIYLRGGAGDPSWSSGGGSGYYGGGGGGTDNSIGGSGAGGSSYSSLLTSIVASNSPNTGMNAPNTSSTYYASGVAVGGSGYEIVGGNGRVVLVYMA